MSFWKHNTMMAEHEQRFVWLHSGCMRFVCLAVLTLCLSSLMMGEQKQSLSWENIIKIQRGIIISDRPQLDENGNPSIFAPFITEPPKVPIIFVTYVFGKAASEKTYLRSFVETARTSGVDIHIVGDHKPPYPLPSNVQHIPITWEEMVGRTEVLLNTTLPNLYNASLYKSIDFKPLFADLFPDLVRPYEFWGHLDNDMLLGDFARVFTPEFLASGDMFNSAPQAQSTHGPLNVYRNNPVMNKLYRLSPHLEEIFNCGDAFAFDEWEFMNAWKEHGLSDGSMTSVFKKHRKRLGLTWRKVATSMNDCHCRTNSNWKCGKCIYDATLAGTGQQLISFAENPESERWNAIFCHYQCGKEDNWASILGNEIEEIAFRMQHESLIASGRFQVGYREFLAEAPDRNTYYYNDTFLE